MRHTDLPAPQPWLAALKSLALPGLGQWHNGQPNRAAWFLLAFCFISVPAVALVALYLPPSWTPASLALGLLAALALWLGSAWDAWRQARRGTVPPHTGNRTATGGLPVWRMGGVTLLILVLCDFVALPALVQAVRAHLVQAFHIPSGSMSPSLLPGDLVFADMRYACVGCRSPVQRGDIAVFAYPNDRTVLYVKRVVALPGDRVQADATGLWVNGRPVPPPAGAAQARPSSAAAGTAAATDASAATTAPASAAPATLDLTVPPGQVFALGDNRARSTDSRQFGTVPLQDVVGRVRQVWFSWGDGGVRWQRLGHLVQ